MPDALPVADDQIEHTGGCPVQWRGVWCRPWPPVCPVQYRTGRRYPRRLAGAILGNVRQCLDSDSYLPFQQSRQRRPHSRRVCVLGSSRTPCAWAMSTVFHGLIPFDCFSRFPSGEKCPAPALTSRCGCLAASSRMSGRCVALCGRWGCLAASSWMKPRRRCVASPPSWRSPVRPVGCPVIAESCR